MTDVHKDKVLEKLERMLQSLPETSRQPILDLIHKRKIELGIKKSGFLPAGYKLKKAKPRPKHQTIESKESLRKIAMGIGRIPEIKQPNLQDLDVKDEPLKKEKKTLEEADSYKY